MKMKNAFRRVLIALFLFVLSLVVILIFIIINWVKFESIPDLLMMVDFTGILLSTLAVSILILVSIGLVFWLARAWSAEQPELGDKIIQLATITNVVLIFVFGGMGVGLIILRTLWTIGYF
tara:strand:- start:2145 stop:2507 length:363 start_codon:yes stop_codon:yes gene_type:complete